MSFELIGLVGAGVAGTLCLAVLTGSWQWDRGLRDEACVKKWWAKNTKPHGKGCKQPFWWGIE